MGFQSAASLTRHATDIHPLEIRHATRRAPASRHKHTVTNSVDHSIALRTQTSEAYVDAHTREAVTRQAFANYVLQYRGRAAA